MESQFFFDKLCWIKQCGPMMRADKKTRKIEIVSKSQNNNHVKTKADPKRKERTFCVREVF